MKFFTCVSFFLLLMTGTTTTVNAVASTATGACSRLHKFTFKVNVGDTCNFWDHQGHVADGTCQKREGVHIFRKLTCVQAGGNSTSGAASPSATPSSAAVLPSSTVSTDTSGTSSTGDGTGSDGTGSDGMGSDGTS